MNEIDRYINLIDEEEVDKILKLFQCNIKLKNIELKKTKIKTIVRANHSISNSKGGISPFVAILMRHKISEWDALNEKEFLITLGNHPDNVYPDYVKLANLLIRYPNEKDKYLKIIDENIKKGKYIFEFNFMFDSKEEVVEYIRKLDNSLTDKFNLIKHFFNNALNSELISIDDSFKDKIMNWDMLDLYKNLMCSEEEQKIWIEFEYINSHKNIEEDVLIKFYFNIVFFLLSRFHAGYDILRTHEVTIIKNTETKIKNDFKQFEKEFLKREKEYKETIKNLNKKVSSAAKGTKELDDIKSKFNVQLDKNEKLTKNVDEQKNKYSLLASQMKEKEKEISKLNEKFKNIELYYQYNFLINKENKKIFGVVHSSNVNVAKMIFSEVEFIDINDWRNNIDNVKEIYIQREGISTPQLIKIKHYCLEKGIKIKKTISIHDEKQLIETISILKSNNIGGELHVNITGNKK